MTSNSTGAANVAVGRSALGANTTASDNIAIGHIALGSNTTGASNTAVGYTALTASTTAGNNTAVGHRALTSVTTGAQNTAIGKDAGDVITTGDSNICIGRESDPSANNTSEIVIGNSVTGKGDNTGFIYPPGGGSMYQGSNATAWAQTSDERIKKNIEDNTTGLDAINQIRVRNFEYRTEDEITDFENPASAVVNKEGVQVGVIAQEIETVLPDVVYEEATGVKTLDADNLTWYLVNSVKELSAKVEDLEKQLNNKE